MIATLSVVPVPLLGNPQLVGVDARSEVQHLREPHSTIVADPLRIPMKPATDSDLKPASHSDFIPATLPI
ncbi:hypothetical protein [Mesorhizobium sp. L48C026A00]|uniref:hypothetical protein n=1 Tax=Mesorhizobium sp. L48C026A00 TaxID=1287182 RepID=UPI0003CFCD0D|nr:hypothetical protein [Mesorhizobium sp. L48C026A00]ESY95521.1 hypothetical protein X737_39985 [Mesorhizobium sp. L48C026A00]